MTHDSHAPVVDVITRTCDRPAFLPRAIASVRAQTFTRWHLILVDSGDAEATAAWLQANPGAPGEQITHLRLAKGPLMGALSNIGIRQGTAPLVVQLDDDDTWDPGFLEKTIARLDRHPADSGCRGVVTRTEIIQEEFSGEGFRETGREMLNPRLQRVTLPALASVNRFTTNAFVYHRQAWEILGGYDETLAVLDDWDFNLRFLIEWDIDLIPEALARWHKRPATGSSQDNSPSGDHDLGTARIINHHVRRKLRGLPAPLADLMMAGEFHRLDADWHHRVLGKLQSVSEKVGRIDNRTFRMSQGK